MGAAKASCGMTIRWLICGMIAGAVLGLAGLGVLWLTGQLGTSAADQAEALRYSLPMLVRLGEGEHALNELGLLVQIDLLWAIPTAVALNIFVIGMLLACERPVRWWGVMILLFLLGTIIAFLIGRAFPDSMWKAQPSPRAGSVRWERIVPIVCGTAAAWIAAYFLGGVPRRGQEQPNRTSRRDRGCGPVSQARRQEMAI
jgi:hypothetical protein